MRQLFNWVYQKTRVMQRLLLGLIALMLMSQLLTLPAWATGVYEIPALSSLENPRILDQAGVMSRLSEGKISSALEELAQQTGSEVHLVTIHRLDYGETAQSFADQLFQAWFPTPEAQANQAVIVLDNVTNGAAIHAGEQVQQRLTTAIADSLVSETLMYPIRKGDNYNEAFLDTSDRLVAVLSGQPDPGPPNMEENIQVEGTFSSAEETQKNRGSSTVWVIGLLAAATIIPMATYYLYLYIQSR